MTFAYHLHFLDPVHFGIEGIGQESIEQTMRSDSLWGAVLQKWFLLFDDEPDKLCRHTPFTVTSCFPVINGVRFFPLPVSSLDSVIEEAAALNRQVIPAVKEWRKVKYLAEPLFMQVLAGKKLHLADIDLHQVYPMHNRDAVQPVIESFSAQEQRPRIMTDQLNGGVSVSAFFYCTDQFFQKGSGLFFLAEFEHDAVQNKFDAALCLLGDCGIGADRSTGRGGFSVNCQEVEFQDVEQPASWLTLSLYHPGRNEVKKGVLINGKYSLVKRSGHAGSVYVNCFQRADCWMLEEGAVLPFRIKGEVPCVLEQSEMIPHNVYRNGRAFCIPIKGRS